MLRGAFRRLLALDDPPERTALAFSVGVFIAFSPFLGLHTLAATALAFIFRFNKVAIYAGTFVNNPFLTLVPITLASYAAGAFVMGRPLGLPERGMALLAEPHPLTASYWGELFGHFWDVLLPFAVGATILSFVCSLAAYPVTLHLLRAARRRREAARVRAGGR
ncbi:MAG TPA: DUF2062 domain-containing protein [Pyrinomonadaceae bacterium]|nr:DUF2062 domain-containing protein [Pyrinomonadaceae bacterium]